MLVLLDELLLELRLLVEVLDELEDALLVELLELADEVEVELLDRLLVLLDDRLLLEELDRLLVLDDDRLLVELLEALLVDVLVEESELTELVEEDDSSSPSMYETRMLQESIFSEPALSEYPA